MDKVNFNFSFNGHAYGGRTRGRKQGRGCVRRGVMVDETLGRTTLDERALRVGIAVVSGAWEEEESRMGVWNQSGRENNFAVAERSCNESNMRYRMGRVLKKMSSKVRSGAKQHADIKWFKNLYIFIIAIVSSFLFTILRLFIVGYSLIFAFVTNATNSCPNRAEIYLHGAFMAVKMRKRWGSSKKLICILRFRRKLSYGSIRKFYLKPINIQLNFCCSCKFS